MAFSRYLAILGGVVLALTVALVGFAALVDPYRLFSWIEVDGFNAAKPQIYNQVHWAKAAAHERSGARTVIFGNSRLDVGMDPESPLWPEGLRPVFNHAVPGLGIQGTAELVIPAVQEGHVRTIVVGLDFLDFLTDEALPPTEAVLRFAPPDGQRGFLAYADVLASLTALHDAAATLLAQGNPNAATMTPLGFNPLRHYNDLVAEEGHYALANQRNRENYRNYARYPKTTLPDPAATTREYTALDAILKAARAKGVAVYLLIYPYHADVLEGFERSGLRPAFDQWKHQVASMTEAAGASVQLWDFSGYSGVATERFPRQGDTHTRLRWYWEPGHFKSSVGDAMLKRLFNAPDARPGFGIPLTPLMVEAVIQDYDAGRLRYLDDEPAEIARINQLFEKIAPQ